MTSKRCDSTSRNGSHPIWPLAPCRKTSGAPLPPRSMRIRVPRSSSMSSRCGIPGASSLRDQVPLAVAELHEAQRQQHDVALIKAHLSDDTLEVLDLLQALLDSFLVITAPLDCFGVELHRIVEIRAVEVGVAAVLLLVAIEVGLHLRRIGIPAWRSGDEAIRRGTCDLGKRIVLDRAVADELGLHAELRRLPYDQAALRVIRVNDRNRRLGGADPRDLRAEVASPLLDHLFGQDRSAEFLEFLDEDRAQCFAVG